MESFNKGAFSMDKLLIPISYEKFKSKVSIRFNNIEEGFNRYENKILTGKEEAMEKFLYEAIKLNGTENSFVDFYYENLDEESKKRVFEMLGEEGRRLLTKFIEGSKSKEVYYNITLESVPLICELNFKEILFSTFYFTRIPLTIWGNYEKRFPCFYEEKRNLQDYIKLIEKCGATLE